jgi:hypothetical protein
MMDLTEDVRKALDTLATAAAGMLPVDVIALQAELDAVYQAKLAELATPPEPPPPTYERWKPARGNRYWTVYGDGSVSDIVWDNDTGDNNIRDFGNCHPSEEVATRKRDRMRALLRLWDLEEQMAEGSKGPLYGKVWILCKTDGEFTCLQADARSLVDELAIAHFHTGEDAERALTILSEEGLLDYLFT